MYIQCKTSHNQIYRTPVCAAVCKEKSRVNAHTFRIVSVCKDPPVTVRHHVC